MFVFELAFWTLLGIFTFFYSGYYSLMYWASKKSSNHDPKTEACPSVSIIIATYNEENVIKAKLENILKLTYAKDKMQLVLVDSGSKDKTQENIQEFMRQQSGNADLHHLNKVIVFEKERKGKANALNTAFQFCNGEIIIITDADVELESDSVSRIVAHFSDLRVGAVTGRAIVKSREDFPTNIEMNYRKVFDLLRQGESNLDSTFIFNGPLSAYRRALIDELREDTVTDDIELAMRIREKGFRTLYDGAAVFYERYPSGLRKRFKQKRRRAQGLAQSLLRHCRLAFKPDYGKFGSIIFPSNFFMSLVSPLLLVVLLMLLVASLLSVPSFFLISSLIFLLGVEMAFRLASKIMSKKPFTPLQFFVVFLDAQLSLLFGMITLINKADYAWEKADEIREKRESAR